MLDQKLYNIYANHDSGPLRFISSTIICIAREELHLWASAIEHDTVDTQPCMFLIQEPFGSDSADQCNFLRTVRAKGFSASAGLERGSAWTWCYLLPMLRGTVPYQVKMTVSLESQTC